MKEQNDFCKFFRKSCGNLSATEVQTLIQTSKRILLDFCEDCLNIFKKTPTQNTVEEIRLTVAYNQ